MHDEICFCSQCTSQDDNPQEILGYRFHNLQKEEVMLPSSTAPSQQQSRSRKGGLNWLNVGELSSTQEETKIIGVRAGDSQYGAQVTLKLAFRGESRFLSIQVFRRGKPNPAYQALETKLGNEENDWVGQRILIWKEPNEFTEQNELRIGFPPEKKGK